MNGAQDFAEWRSSRHERKLLLMPTSVPESITIIREQAASWLARQQSGNFSIKDRQRLDAWLAADDRHRRELESLYALWHAVGDLADSAVVRVERRRVAAQSVFLWQPVLAAAFVIVAAFGLFQFVGIKEPTRFLHLTTAFGERKQIVLDDGTQLHIDADSALVVHLSASRQRVVVERGAAYFEVAHRPGRVFEVEAGAGRIVDIGTRFGVRLEEGGRTSVAVAEGEVEASLVTGDGPLHRVIAGQGLTLAPQSVGQTVPFDADSAFAWREGRVVFDRTPLREAVTRINRYRKEPLAIVDASLEELRVSGVFSLDDSRSFIWALEQTLPLRAVSHKGQIDLVARRGDAREMSTPLLR